MTRMATRRPPLDVELIAIELTDLVQARSDDARLHWGPDHAWVHVKVAPSLPSDEVAKRTREGWERRLREALRTRLLEAGWMPLGSNRYAPMFAGEASKAFNDLTPDERRVAASAFARLNGKREVVVIPRVEHEVREVVVVPVKVQHEAPRPVVVWVHQVDDAPTDEEEATGGKASYE